MELKEIEKEKEPKNLTDTIVESMFEANADANIYIEPLSGPIPQAETKLMLKPEPINRLGWFTGFKISSREHC